MHIITAWHSGHRRPGTSSRLASNIHIDAKTGAVGVGSLPQVGANLTITSLDARDIDTPALRPPLTIDDANVASLNTSASVSVLGTARAPGTTPGTYCTPAWCSLVPSEWGSGGAINQGIVFDSSDNLLLSGIKDPNPLVVRHLLTEEHIFTTRAAHGWTAIVLKYSSSGHPIWCAMIDTSGENANETANDVSVDGMDNVLVTGSQPAGIDTVVYDGSGAPVQSLARVNDRGAYLVKYSSSGSFLWAKTLEGVGSDGGLGTSCDASSNVYWQVSMNVSASLFDVRVSASSSLAFPTPSASMYSAVLKFNESGGLLWTVYTGPSVSSTIPSPAVDLSGNVYTVYNFTASQCTVYDSSAQAVLQLPSKADAQAYGYLLKISPAGAPTWAATLGGPGATVNVRGVCTDRSLNVVVTGFYSASSSGCPVRDSNGDHVYTLPDTGNQNAMFISKYTPSGMPIWTVRVVGRAEPAYRAPLTVDNSDNIIVCGWYKSTSGCVVYGPNDAARLSAVPHHPNTTNNRILVLKLNSSGEPLWASQTENMLQLTDLYTNSIATDSHDRIAVCGSYLAAQGHFELYDSSGLAVVQGTTEKPHGGFVTMYHDQITPYTLLGHSSSADTFRKVLVNQDVSGTAFVRDLTRPQHLYIVAPGGKKDLVWAEDAWYEL